MSKKSYKKEKVLEMKSNKETNTENTLDKAMAMGMLITIEVYIINKKTPK